MIFAIAITAIPGCTRVVRSVVLSIKAAPYVEAARAVGVPTWRLMLLHVAPQCIAPLTVIATLTLGSAIFAESSLSFLGLGVQPPTPAWGSMLAEGQSYFQVAWWNAFYPGVAILLAVNLIGDRLADLR